MQGLGVTFLEETFSSSAAHPPHRYHQKAARATLKALLPESGTDIKGHMRSREDLLNASGYSARPGDFEDLMHILDPELRLITPTDPEGQSLDADDLPAVQTSARGRFYQLTHDYLVLSLREWLTRKQKQTWKGRAELRLVERSALWNAKPENRRLPAWWEVINILLLTRPRNWTATQRRMIRRAMRVHAVRWNSAVLLLLLLGIAFQRLTPRDLEAQVKAAVMKLEVCSYDSVPSAIADLQACPRQMAIAELQARLAASPESSRFRLHLGLAHCGLADVEWLVSRIGGEPAEEVDNLVEALEQAKSDAVPAIQVAASRQSEDWDWRAKIHMAVTALHLGDVSVAQEMCRLGPDPVQRTTFIEEFASRHGDLTRLAELAQTIEDAGLRSGLSLSLGSVVSGQVAIEDRQAWHERLSQWYLQPEQGGTHVAADWALRQWNLHVPEVPASGHTVADNPGWHVNSLGMTLVRIPQGSVVPRARDNAIDSTKPTRVQRGLFLSSSEVSVGHFRQFIDDPKCPPTEKPEKWRGVDEVVSPTPEHPVQRVSWYDGVLFCNWLSLREGLAACYRRTGRKEQFKNYDGEKEEHDVWERVPDVVGYRLPTEDEWERACRSESGTTYCFGDDESLLSCYAVYNRSGAQPCGRLLPNGWGLFDMHGNVWEWCEDLDSGSYRVIRGGSWIDPAGYCTPSTRFRYEPTYRDDGLGFRVALVPSASQANEHVGGAR